MPGMVQMQHNEGGSAMSGEFTSGIHTNDASMKTAKSTQSGRSGPGHQQQQNPMYQNRGPVMPPGGPVPQHNQYGAPDQMFGHPPPPQFGAPQAM